MLLELDAHTVNRGRKKRLKTSNLRAFFIQIVAPRIGFSWILHALIDLTLTSCRVSLLGSLSVIDTTYISQLHCQAIEKWRQFVSGAAQEFGI